MNDNIRKIKESIASADVVSFDIFDTLIVRLTAKAEDVFKIMEHKTGIKGFAKAREELQTKCSIMIEQTKMEPHATFDDIYEYMEKNCSLELRGYSWQQLKKLELDTECEILVRNIPMYEVYKHAKEIGKRVVLTSDMYLSAKEIAPILNNCGYTDYDRLYVSSDCKKTKYRLDLFKYVAEMESVNPGKIVHIGDNYQDDVINAEKCGFKSELYKSTRVKADMDLYQSVCTGVFCYLNNCDDSFWYNIGAKAGGPLYCGFIDKISEKINEIKPDKTYFLSRDGYNLYNVIKNTGIIEGKTEYLYASRRAMLLCGIDKLDDTAKNLLPPYTFGQSVKDILDYLDLGEISENSVKKCGFSGYRDIIKNTADFKKFKKIIENEDKLFIKKAEEERKSFKKYLNKCDFMNCKALVFDCGWNGSSQYLLDRALNLMNYNGENSFIYVGLMNSEKCRKQLAGKKYDAIVFDQNKNRELYKRVERSIVLLELFFGAPHGSVWKYADNEHGFIEESIEAEFEYKNEILRGITDFVKIAYPLLNKLNITGSAEDCLFGVLKLIEFPTEEEAVKIGNLENVDGFVSKKNEKKYIAKLTLEDIKNNPNELYWPQGIYARKDIDHKVKKYVEEKTGVKMKNNKAVMTTEKRQNIFKRVSGYINQYGPATTAYLIKNKIKRKNEKTPYEYFVEKSDKDILRTEELSYKPLISFVVPVYNVLDYQLRECIDSILNQTYDNFELILVDDKSTWESVPKTLAEYEINPKITVIYREENGHISRSTNTGIEAAKGEYIAFTDCDDVVAPNAVFEITKLLNKDKSLDFIYSDEDKLTEDSKKRHFPHFKPDWSPDTFMSHMYTSHLSVYRRSIVNEIGGLRVGFEGSQDYDFTMRFVEKTNRIGHIPKVLYYWRQRPESTSSDLSSKPYVMEAMLKLKTETLERRGLKGDIIYVPDVRQYRVIYDIADNGMVSIIIPSKDNCDVLKRCIKSIKEKTEYNNYEIIVVDNGSNTENKAKCESMCAENNVVYYYEKMKFNFSKMCNKGAKMAKGKYLLFLNDDTEVVEPDWLRRMAGHAALDYVGAVGAKLLYPGGTLIQHCGVINLPLAGPCHALLRMDDSVPHYFCRNKLEYNYIAVTAACLCISKNKFNEVGGFDEDLTVSYNDIDLCFKLYEKGYYNVVRNDAVLYHYESLSRGYDLSGEKKERLNNEYKMLCSRHPELNGKDPFYNINFAPDRIDFQVDYDNYKNIAVKIAENIDIMPLVNERVKGYADNVAESSTIEITGWAFIAAMPLNNLNKKSVVLIDEYGKGTIFSTSTMLRVDVSAAFGSKGSLNLSGFKCCIKRDNLKKGRYKLGIFVKNRITLKKGVVLLDKYIEI